MLKFRISAQVHLCERTVESATKAVARALALVTRHRVKVATHVLGPCEPDKKCAKVTLLDINPRVWWNGGPNNSGCYLTKVSLNFSTKKVRGTVLVDGRPKSWYFAMDDPNIEFRGFSR